MLVLVGAEGARALHLDCVLGDADGLRLKGKPTVKSMSLSRVWEAFSILALRTIKIQDQLATHFR